MKTMKIKLLCREIELNKIIDNIDELEPALCGAARISKFKIYFDGSRPFSTLFHELTHQYLALTGRHEEKNFGAEETCDTFGFLLEQLILENGIGVIETLHKFAEVKL